MAIAPRRVAGVLVAVALAMALTVPSTAATTSLRDHRPATMRMEYAAGDLSAVLYAPRTLVGSRPLVVNFRGYDVVAQAMAQRGSVVVLVSDRTAVDRHLELWRELSAGAGPLAERFAGFAGHFSVAEP